MREEAYKKLVDVKCNNCGDYLKFAEVDEHSQVCLGIKNSISTINIYF